MSFNLFKELCLDILIGKQKFDEGMVNLPRAILHGSNNQFAVIVHKTRIGFE